MPYSKDRQVKPDGVKAELSTAIGMYRSMDMTLWLPQAETALTQIGKVEQPAMSQLS